MQELTNRTRAPPGKNWNSPVHSPATETDAFLIVARRGHYYFGATMIPQSITVVIAAATMTLVAAPIGVRAATGPIANNAQVAKGIKVVRFGDDYDARPLVFVDTHPYRHCHNIHTRVYCHKKDRLPLNWPPNTDTPHGSTFENPPRTPQGRRL